MKSKIVLICIGLFLSACVSPRPAQEEFIINTKVRLNAVKEEKVLPYTIKIAHPYSDTTFNSSNMYYVEDNQKEFHYAASKWAKSPNSMINEKIITMVRDMKHFQFVQTAKSRTKNDFVLESNINDFKQYFENNNTKSYVISSITFTLVGSKSHKIISSKTFESKVEVEHLNAVGGVNALNKSLNTILEDAYLWLSEVRVD